jgi:tetratricopeptide (TPR) repeat protein
MSFIPQLPGFLSPAPLILASRVRPIVSPAWGLLWLGVPFLLVMLIPLDGAAGQVVRSGVLLGGLGSVLFVLTRSMRQRATRMAGESDRAEQIEELIQLRRWPEAADRVNAILSQPMLSPGLRMACLMSLAMVLARYHRFEEARDVHGYLLKPDAGDPIPDESTAHNIRVARAMSLLRDDHLVDATRAMAELKRDVGRVRDAHRRAAENAGAEPPVIESAGLMLLELYCDVKTGHYREAIELFDKQQDELRDQLSHRLADALMLIASACAATGQTDRAKELFDDATLLVPAVELFRRYPETENLTATFRTKRSAVTDFLAIRQ